MKHGLSTVLEQAALSPFGIQNDSSPFWIVRTGAALLFFYSYPSSLAMNGDKNECGGEHITSSLLQSAPFGEEKGGHQQLAVKVGIYTYYHDIAVAQR